MQVLFHAQNAAFRASAWYAVAYVRPFVTIRSQVWFADAQCRFTVSAGLDLYRSD